METTNEVQINVLTNFQLSIPVSGDPAAFVFTQIAPPSFGITLTRVYNNEESFHYEIQMVRAHVSEEVVSDGLLWAKRTPHLFKKIENTEKIEALLCRLKIAAGVFNFRRNKYRSIRFVVRCFSNNVLLSTGISQICRVLPKKRLADDESSTVIQICWQPDSLPASDQPQIESALPQYYSTPEDHDEDSIMATFNNSDEHFQSSSNEIDEDLSLIQVPTSNASYSASELHSAFANEHSDQYMVLYNGNAEVIGNFRALNFYKASDINIKEDVRLLSSDGRDPRSVLLKIDGVEYKFKDSVRHTTNKRFVGYIAQQIESVVPEAVQLIDGILHVDYESLIPYLSESIKQNFKDITEIKADASQIHKVVDLMYAEFVRKESKKKKSTTDTSKTTQLPKDQQQSRNRSLRWIIGTSLAVLLLVSVAIGVFFIRTVPLAHETPYSPGTQPSPETQPSPGTTPSSDSHPPTVQFPSMDQDAVVDFYMATFGSSRWTTTNASPDLSVCEWEGIVCDDNFRVVSIRTLKDYDLSGTLPDSIGKLEGLRILYLPKTKLSGTIPTSIGNLTNLVELNLENSKLHGTVPAQMLSLPFLETLHLGYNYQLIWTIPPQIANMKQLKIFSAPSSGLRGTLPNEISNLTNLHTLDLTGNGLTGAVPTLEYTSINRLMLATNFLGGFVPKMNETAFANSKYRNIIDLKNNNFFSELDLPVAILQSHFSMFNITSTNFHSVSQRLQNITTTQVECSAIDVPFDCPIPEWMRKACGAVCT